MPTTHRQALGLGFPHFQELPLALESTRPLAVILHRTCVVNTCCEQSKILISQLVRSTGFSFLQSQVALGLPSASLLMGLAWMPLLEACWCCVEQPAVERVATSDAIADWCDRGWVAFARSGARCQPAAAAHAPARP